MTRGLGANDFGLVFFIGARWGSKKMSPKSIYSFIKIAVITTSHHYWSHRKKKIFSDEKHRCDLLNKSNYRYTERSPADKA